jgi:hypothetical protein
LTAKKVSREFDRTFYNYPYIPVNRNIIYEN